MDDEHGELPRYQFSPTRLEFERERSPIDITEKEYTRMIALSEGTSRGNILKATGYSFGIFGFKQDFKEALKYYKLAAEQGSADGMYNLGVFYSQGRGVPQNHKEAVQWWTRAASQDFKVGGEENTGVKESEAALGSAYFHGKGVDKNPSQAIAFWEKSAQHGCDVALNNLGAEYQHGRIVERDLDKAKMYYNAAAMKGAETAQYNLGMLEIESGNFEKGKKWLQMAAKNKHPLAQQELNNLHPPEVLDVVEKFANLSKFITKHNATHVTNHSEEERYPFHLLCKYAPKSKIAASLLTAKMYSLEALELLEEEGARILKDVEKMRKFASIAAECYKITETVFEFYSASLQQLTFKVLNKLHSLDPNNVDAMLGLCFDFSQPYYETIDRVELWIKQKKKIPRMYEVLALLYLFVQNYPKALWAINKAITEEHDYAHFFVHGSVYRIMGSTKEGLADFDTFLQRGDPEDRKVPNAYFGKAQLYLLDQNLDKAEEAFAIGCKKDKEALPFFRHKEATQKAMVEQLLELARMGNKKTGNKKKVTTKKVEIVKFSKEWELKYQDIRRIEIVTSFRDIVRQNGKSSEMEKVTKMARKQQPPPPTDLDNLKSIFLEDMECKDKVYNGTILSCKIIELPAVYVGVYTLIEDDQGQVQKIGFYNFGIENNSQAKEKFWIGKRIAVVNPYMRIGMADNKPYIRVELPESVISYPTDFYSACALCQSPASTKCSRCHTTFYCSKRCQEIDWKAFKHKLVCA